ncbi:YetF domain-containing protein, partial [Salmonella sp. SAL4456]|uniref:YetF domain-containing protein n=1 Tax=Salmonella sp. SAL4456 TaxID=3159911 RepID=UPI003979FE55
MERLLHPPPVPLVRDGRLLRRTLRRELITEEELLSHVREQGLTDFTQVRAAYMEGDGQISVIPREGQAQG